MMDHRSLVLYTVNVSIVNNFFNNFKFLAFGVNALTH